VPPAVASEAMVLVSDTPQGYIGGTAVACSGAIPKRCW
jgi:hypothetical protein